MCRRSSDPFSDWWKVFSSFMPCGGRRFYTRKERVEALENLKRQLEKEIAGIEELIQDLKQRTPSGSTEA